MSEAQQFAETDSEAPTFPFEVNSIDVTGPYPLTPKKNKYLTFVDHFTRYVEAYPASNQTAK